MSQTSRSTQLNPDAEIAAAKAMGSTGHWPVPSGYQPLGMGKDARTFSDRCLKWQPPSRSVRLVAGRHRQVACATRLIRTLPNFPHAAADPAGTGALRDSRYLQKMLSPLPVSRKVFRLESTRGQPPETFLTIVEPALKFP